MKKGLKIIGISILLILLLRGWLYRGTVVYHSIGNRDYITIDNQELLKKINEEAKNFQHIELQQIIHIANSICLEQLSFSSQTTSQNPNKTYTSGQANCIGYSALFNSIANHLILQFQLKHKYHAQHHIGELHFLGIDIHQFFDHPFFHDHDFNTITDLKEKKIIATDPSLNDYFGIKRVSFK